MKKNVEIGCGNIVLEGNLTIPQDARGMVIFAHGSGSSRFSPRNVFVAEILNRASIATLLLDLLTPQEAMLEENRFDIGLLASRLDCSAQWLKGQEEAKGMKFGYFGASTGAAAAIRAASASDSVSAVVSRGGRPDLAGDDALQHLKCPTLLIVGGRDDIVLELNRKAFSKMHCSREMKIVPGATHLFEEEGALDAVAIESAHWFSRHLS